MSSSEQPGEPIAPQPRLIDPAAAWTVGAIAVVVVVAALSVFTVLRKSGPTPAELAGDPLLAKGHELFLSRCASCHGEKGRGDGPIAQRTQGPPPGDLTDANWKHGGAPAQVLAVIRDGVPGTGMSGYGKYRILDADEIRAVTAYVFRLAGSEVPPELRSP